MKTLIKIALTLMVIVATGCSSPTTETTQTNDKPIIGVVQLVEHTSLNTIKSPTVT